MAMIKPVPGWIMFMVEISGSFGPTTELTFFCARSWVFGIDRGLDGQPAALDHVLALLDGLAQARAS